MFSFESADEAANWFNYYSYILFAGAVLVAMGTYGTIIAGKAKDRFSDERVAANEAETKRAIADSDSAREGTARANERAAALEKDAANARLETERLKGVVAWRTLSQSMVSALERELASSPGNVNLRYIDGDPEALYLAIQIGNILAKAKWNVAPGAVKPAGAIVFGIAIPDTPAAANLRKAFSAANIPFSGDQMPEVGVSFNVSTIDGAPELLIGSRPPPALK